MKAINNLTHQELDLVQDIEILEDIQFSGGGGCFIAGTKINTPTGYRNIEDIQANDYVYAFDDETGVVQIGQVESINSHSWQEVHLESPLLILTYLKSEASVDAEGNEVDAEYGTLTLTANHWVYQKGRSSIKPDVPNNYVEARELAVGDVLVGEYNQSWPITEIVDGPEYDFVYNFEVTKYHSYIADKIRVHNGGGGGKSSSKAPVEAPNSLRSRQVVRFQEVVSEGEIKGVVGEAKGVYLNGTQLQNQDGSFNFTNASLQFRNGLPVQSAMSGFSASESETAAPGKITWAATGGTAVVANLAAATSAVRLTFYVPSLMVTDPKSGDTNPTSVQLQIFRKPHNASTWELVRNETIVGKCVSPYYFSYRIERPSTPGLFDIKVQRVTPDSTIQTLQNDLYWSSYTAISDVQSTYPYTAYVGVTAGSDTTGNSIPLRAYDVEGILVKVPSNYDPVTRSYTGAWDGTFAPTKKFTDNPAWHVYDLLTNDRYGCGDFVDESLIDVWSFYEAAVYNDQLVNDGKGNGTFEPRFTFNDQIFQAGQAWNVIQGLASSFNAVVATSNAMVTLIQDRPREVSNLVTNSNVVDGEFRYTSSPSSSQYNAVQVTYKDPNNNNLEVVVREEYAADIAADKEKLQQIQAPGCTTEGQARRSAKWALDTNKYSTDIVEFKVTLDNAFIGLGDVIEVMDEYYAGVVQEGRVVSASGNQVIIDKPVAIGTGTWTLKTYKADGTSLESFQIASLNQTTSSIVVTGSPTAVPGSIWVIVGNVSPRQFRINSIKEDSEGIYTLTGTQYDPTKWQRVEEGVSVAPPVFIQPSDQRIVTPPQNIQFQERSFFTPEGSTRRYLDVGWQPGSNDMISSYKAYYSKDSGPLVDLGTVQQPEVSILCENAGTYRITVYANSITGRQSLPATMEYTVDLFTPVEDGKLLSVTDLQVEGGGRVFKTPDLTVEWTDPNNNAIGLVVAGYRVTLEDEFGKRLRSEVIPKNQTRYTYRLADNVKDSGNATGIGNRKLRVMVNALTTFQRTSPPNIIVVENPKPVPPAFSVTPLLDQTLLTIDSSAAPDLGGYKVWMAPGTGAVVPWDQANLVYAGPAIQLSLTKLADGSPMPRGSTYTIRVAAYDSFSRDTGDLLISNPTTFTTATANADLNTYVTDGITFTSNALSDTVSWTGGTVTKTGGMNSGAPPGTTWTVVAGTTRWYSGNVYVYFSESDNIQNANGSVGLRDTTNINTAYTHDSLVLAIYKGGANLIDSKGSFIVDGTQILAGSIGPEQLVSSNVITLTSQIKDDIITNAKISSLDASKINTGLLNPDRIDTKGLTIKALDGTPILGADYQLTGEYIMDSTIGGNHINDSSITSSKIAGILQSSDYLHELSGWMINRNTGQAQFLDVMARGNIEASSTTANSVVTNSMVANSVSTFKYSDGASWISANVSGQLGSESVTDVCSITYDRSSTDSTVIVDFSAILEFSNVVSTHFTNNGQYVQLELLITTTGGYVGMPAARYPLYLMRRQQGETQIACMNNSPYNRFFIKPSQGGPAQWGTQPLTTTVQVITKWTTATKPVSTGSFSVLSSRLVVQEMKR